MSKKKQIRSIWNKRVNVPMDLTRKKAEENYKLLLDFLKLRKRSGKKVPNRFIKTVEERIEKLEKGGLNEKEIERMSKESKILLEGQADQLIYGGILTKEENEKLERIKSIEDPKERETEMAYFEVEVQRRLKKKE